MHPFARSRGLRALAVIAWLMSFMGSLAGTPLMTPGPHHEVIGAAAPSAPAHHMYRLSPGHALASHCCDAPCHGADTVAGHFCCPGVCVSDLPAASVALTMPTRDHPRYAKASVSQAPTMDLAVPLRPPSV